MPKSKKSFRERTLSLLYEAEIKGLKPSQIIKEIEVDEDHFVTSRLLAVESHREEIDMMIDSHSLEWELNRMPLIDLCLLRIAVSELLEDHHPPKAVIISEAVELAKNFSTDSSSKFVNGVLSAVSSDIEKETDDSADGPTTTQQVD